MEERNLICIGCPMGCPLTVKIDGKQMEVSGHTCKRGEDYARKEVLSPARIVTSSICVSEGVIARVSVKTRNDIPKARIFDVMKEIRKARVTAPVVLGQVLIPDCAGTGVDIIATKGVAHV